MGCNDLQSTLCHTIKVMSYEFDMLIHVMIKVQLMVDMNNFSLYYGLCPLIVSCVPKH